MRAEYEEVMEDWLRTGIIEEMPLSQRDEGCFVTSVSSKGRRAIHREWLRRLLNTIYIQHMICHIMMKVEWICTGRTNECGVLTIAIRILFGNWSKECVIDRDLLGPRNLSKRLNLSMCNRLMCFTFHFQNSVS